MKRLHRASIKFIIACLPLALISLDPSPRARAQQEAPSARPSPDTVVLNVAVLDRKGAYVDGLPKNYFSVFDGKTPQEITFFRGQEDAPASVGILLDASGSLASGKIERVGAALARFMRESHRENEYFLIGFNERPQLLADWTRDGQEILSRITNIKPQGVTAFYDACYLGVEKVMRGRSHRRVLLLISDGVDTFSRYSFRELTKLLQESDVTLYSVGLHGVSDPGSSLGMEGRAVLDQLAEITGGSAYSPETFKELDLHFGRLAYELRHQYQLGFRPADAARDGKWHKIKVEVTVPAGVAPPGLKIARVRTREGYYATRNPH